LGCGGCMKEKVKQLKVRARILKKVMPTVKRSRLLFMPNWEPIYVMNTMIIDGDVFSAYRDPECNELRWRMV
jgi:hypothetical protein